MIENVSYTTIAFATEILSLYDNGSLSSWEALTNDQKTVALNVAAMHLEIGYCLPSCLKDMTPIPLNIQKANVLLVQENLGGGSANGILSEILSNASTVQVDVLRVSRAVVATNPAANPFSVFIDRLMEEMGFYWCTGNKMAIYPYRSVG